MLKMKTADILTGIFLCVLGLSMLIGGYVMDRLEIRQIHPASIPGLVPMILGALLALCGLLLTVTSMKKESIFEINIHDPKMLFTALVLCLGFSLVLLGWIPFALATFVFISLATFAFGVTTDMTPQQKAMYIGKAILFGAVMSAAISALFRYAFLVRLP